MPRPHTARLVFGPGNGEALRHAYAFALLLDAYGHTTDEPFVTDFGDRCALYAQTADLRSLAPETYGPVVRGGLESTERAFGRAVTFDLPEGGVSSPAPKPRSLVVSCDRKMSGSDFGQRDLYPVRRGDNRFPAMTPLLGVGEAVRNRLMTFRRTYVLWDTLRPYADESMGPTLTRPIADPESGLNREARELAAEVEAASNLPTFLYMPRVCGHADELSGGPHERGCPRCRRRWDAADDDLFDFRCEPCRLVGDTPAYEASTEADHAMAAIADGRLRL